MIPQEMEQIDWRLPHCPAPPHWSVDWPAIERVFPFLAPMAGCEQDPTWHREGDVLTHTRMVCQSLSEMPSWRSLPATDRSIVFAAALLHDVAKPAVSRVEDGRIRSTGHSAKGARMSRLLCWQSPEMFALQPLPYRLQFSIRRQIVGLVRYHGAPLHLLRRENPERDVISLSQIARCDLLTVLAEADVRGRIADDTDDLVEHVELFRQFATEHDCLTGPRSFASAHTRWLYLQGRDISPDVEAYDDTRFHITMMAGLPGSGKNTWIAENLPDLPVISLDAIRREIGAPPTGNQGPVVQLAKDRAREYMRACEPFVWNATSASISTRTPLLRLFFDYGARVRIVYLEPPWQELLRRNKTRPERDRLPEDALRRLAERIDIPEINEAQQVDYF